MVGEILYVASMTEIPYKDQSRDGNRYFFILLLNRKDFETCLTEIYRVLKRGEGFSYIPGKDLMLFKTISFRNVR